MLYYQVLAAVVAFGVACMDDSRCQPTVYYLPLEIELYVPPTPEYLQKYGTRIEGESLRSVCELLKHVRGLTEWRELRGEEDRMRVQIVDASKKESVFVTAEQEVIRGRRVYEVDQGLMAAALSEIVRHASSRKTSG